MTVVSLGPFITNLTDKLFQPLFFSLIAWLEPSSLPSIDPAKLMDADEDGQVGKKNDIPTLKSFRRNIFYRVVVRLVEILHVCGQFCVG